MSQEDIRTLLTSADMTQIHKKNPKPYKKITGSPTHTDGEQRFWWLILSNEREAEKHSTEKNTQQREREETRQWEETACKMLFLNSQFGNWPQLSQRAALPGTQLLPAQL